VIGPASKAAVARLLIAAIARLVAARSA
jgi:hypothetical protein